MPSPNIFARSRMRAVASSKRLRIRRLLGVTSKISSSAKNSIQSSSVMRMGVTSRSASSLPELLVFVKCLRLQTLTTISSPRGFMPTTIPAYTGTPAPMNSVPRSCALNSP